MYDHYTEIHIMRKQFFALLYDALILVKIDNISRIQSKGFEYKEMLARGGVESIQI